MDVYVEDISYGVDTDGLSYDDATTYEEQVAALPVEEVPRNGALELASRISANKVYLPPESLSKGKSFRPPDLPWDGKRKRDEDEDDAMEEEEDGLALGRGPFDPRPNALRLCGTPIAHLPTNHIFAYARQYNTEPVGLEWIDDTSCVLVFPTNAACRSALDLLRKSPSEEPDFDDCFTAKPVPVTLWPPEDRVNKSLGVASGLEGPLLVRVARMDDKKARGAKHRSAFYQKHGEDAGKDPNAHAIGHALESEGTGKRQRVNANEDEEKRRQLDAELDDFLRDGEERSPSPPPSPPSKMRSDYLTDSGHRKDRGPKRSLLERTSLIRSHLDDDEYELASAQNGVRRRRARGGRGRRKEKEERPTRPLPRRRGRGNGGERVKAPERPVKSRQELDDELEAFLNEKD